MAKKDEKARGTVERDAATAIEKRKSAELSTAFDESQAAKEIEIAAVLAHRRPRNQLDAYAGIMITCERKTFAERGYYVFPRGGRDIKGPSVQLARMMAAEWGNIRYGGGVVRDDDKSRKVRGWAWDVERNVFIAAEDEFKKMIQRKIDKGKANERTEWITPDERDLRELTNKRLAILIRNSLLQVLPVDFVDDALARCFSTVAAGATVDSERESSVKRMMVEFGKIGVTAAMVEKYFGVGIKALSAENIATLRGIYRAIRDGDHSAAEFFGRASSMPESGKVDIKGFKVVDEKETGDGKAKAKKRGRSKTAKSDANAGKDDATHDTGDQNPATAKNGADGDTPSSGNEPESADLNLGDKTEPSSEDSNLTTGRPNPKFNDELDALLAKKASEIEPTDVDEMCVKIHYPRIDDPANIDMLCNRSAYKSALAALAAWAEREELR